MARLHEPATTGDPAPYASIVSGINQEVDPSYGWRPRGTRDWLLVVTVQGRGYVTTPIGRRMLTRGDALLIAPNTPQQYGHPDDNNVWINFWVHFQPRDHWLPWLAWPKLSKNVMLHSTGDRIREVEGELRRMVEIAHGPSQLSRDASMNSLERVLIWAYDFNPASAFSKLDDRIRRSLEIIGERLKDRLTVESLSREVGLSRSRFTLLFNAQVNLSPQAYVEATRMARAAHLLHSSTLTVSMIAEAVGFPNAYYFSTRFRRRFGVPPSVYRKSIEPEGAVAL
ncbi:MAG: helix-turn-helix domain-containing protein [Devosia sp.]